MLWNIARHKLMHKIFQSYLVLKLPKVKLKLVCLNMPCNYIKKVTFFYKEDLGNAVLLVKGGEQSLTLLTHHDLEINF